MSGPDTVPHAPDSRPPFAQTTSENELAEQALPERTWQENPLIWIGIVVTVFMAVPFLANLATRDAAVTVPKPRAQAASSAAPLEPAQATVAPARAEPAPVAPVAPPATPAPTDAQPRTVVVEPARQMITKCLEKGRVVYTQTGACAGSVTSVPIDPGKNVVGPGSGTASAPGGTTR